MAGNDRGVSLNIKERDINALFKKIEEFRGNKGTEREGSVTFTDEDARAEGLLAGSGLGLRGETPSSEEVSALAERRQTEEEAAPRRTKLDDARDAIAGELAKLRPGRKPRAGELATAHNIAAENGIPLDQIPAIVAEVAKGIRQGDTQRISELTTRQTKLDELQAAQAAGVKQPDSSKLRNDIAKAEFKLNSFNEGSQEQQQKILDKEQQRKIEVAEATQAIQAPSPSQLKEISELRSSEDALFDLRNLFDKSFVGLFEGPKGQALNVFGLNPDNQAEFLAASATLENKVIKDITGAQMSEEEASRILRQVPRPNDADNVWAAKYRQTLKNIERIRRRKIEIIKQSGKRDISGDRKTTASPSRDARPGEIEDLSKTSTQDLLNQVQ